MLQMDFDGIMTWVKLQQFSDSDFYFDGDSLLTQAISYMVCRGGERKGGVWLIFLIIFLSFRMVPRRRLNPVFWTNWEKIIESKKQQKKLWCNALLLPLKLWRSAGKKATVMILKI